jgi:hypothetical protein
MTYTHVKAVLPKWEQTHHKHDVPCWVNDLKKKMSWPVHFTQKSKKLPINFDACILWHRHKYVLSSELTTVHNMLGLQVLFNFGHLCYWYISACRKSRFQSCLNTADPVWYWQSFLYNYPPFNLKFGALISWSVTIYSATAQECSSTLEQTQRR